MADDEFVGLDTNVLIDIIENPLSAEYLHNHPLITRCRLCTTTINVDEAEQHFGKEKVNILLISLKITVLKLTVEDLQFSLRLEQEHRKDGAHQPDTAILACFLNNLVRIVMSIDFSFCRVAEKLGLRAIKIPSRDVITDIMFKRAFKKF